MEIVSSKQSKTYVKIITHESTAVHLDFLTEFFLSFCDIRTGVSTFVVDDNVDDHFDLEKNGDYSKQLVDLNYLRNLENLEEKPSPVTFIFAHGTAHDGFISASINFNDNDDIEWRVWSAADDSDEGAADDSDEGPVQDRVLLKEVIGNTALVFLMCCNGGSVVLDFNHANEDMDAWPDILYYDCSIVHTLTIEIVVALLIKILSTDYRLDKDPDSAALHFAVKASILVIFALVKSLHNDSTRFWKFLFDFGCISLLEEPYYNTKTKETCSYIQVYGHQKVMVISESLFDNLKLQLESLSYQTKNKDVYRDGDGYTTKNYESPLNKEALVRAEGLIERASHASSHACHPTSESVTNYEKRLKALLRKLQI
jgi:hypothetical protein